MPEKKVQPKSQRSHGELVRYHVARIAMFILANFCAVIGVLNLTNNLNMQSTAVEATSKMEVPSTDCSVLLIESYGDGNPSVPLERAGVTDVMERSGVALDVEYMDTRNYPIGYGASKAWSDMIRERLAAHGRYDVVICADDDALDAVERIHEQVFSDVPVVFFSVNDLDHAREVAAKGYATGITESGHVKQIMEAAAGLQPDSMHFVAIVDNSALGQASLKQYQETLSNMPGYTGEVWNASEMSRDELKEKLAACDSDNIVLQLAAYSDDAGQGYSLDSTTKLFTTNCEAPVYRESAGGVGSGLVGGSFVDYEAQGTRAAEFAVKILNGTNPSDIPVEGDKVTNTVFDADAIKTHGLDRSLLPSNAAVLNEGVSAQSLELLVKPVLLIVAAMVLLTGFIMLGYRRSFDDSKEIIKSRDALDYQLKHDNLTKLPNRYALMQAGEDAANGKMVSIITLDFDDFKDLNDSYGHTAGDSAIAAIGERLSENLPKAYVARTSGDEYVLGFDHPLDRQSEELKILDKTIKKPIQINDFTVEITVSMGVVNREPNDSFEDMVRFGDLAMHVAKETKGRNSVSFYDENMKRRMDERITITSCLRKAIEEESFVVVYQPQVNTASREVVGYEALVRMKDNQYYPGQFIPVAESAGLVDQIDRIVTKKVVKQLGSWSKRRKRMRPVAINYSAAQMRDRGYLDYLAGLLRDNDVSPSMIKVEITESLMLGNEEESLALFHKIHDMGMKLALDDFGTGYSSLARMAALPVDYVKLDKSLVDEFMVPGRESFIADVTHLVHELDKAIIVEGVETEEQYKICRQLGCDEIQGYYFARPLRAEEAVNFKPE